MSSFVVKTVAVSSMRMNLKFIPNATALVRDRLKNSPFALTVTALILRGVEGDENT